MPEKHLSEYKSVLSLMEEDNTINVSSQNKLFCAPCQCMFTFNPEDGIGNIKRHIKSAAHMKKKAFYLELNETIIKRNNETSGYENQHSELLKTFIKLDWPLRTIESVQFKNFAKCCLNFLPYSETTYRKNYLPKLFEEEFQKY